MPLLHYFLHLGFPLLIAWLGYRRDWQCAYGILLATMLVDLDHLFATPIFQADRCSIGFHPLHTVYVWPVYLALLFGPRWVRLVGIGLLLHMVTDFIDCGFTYQRCPACLSGARAEPWLRALLGS